MAYTYATYKAALQTLVASQSPDDAFDAILPSCIDYAEQRIYRELNLLNTVQIDTTVTLVPSQRTASIPTTFVAVNTISALTPAGADANNGVRSVLVPVSIDLLNAMWPGNADTGAPSMFAMVDQWNIVIGPSPDGAYQLEINGTYRPAPLSASNTTTFLTERLPDLFLAASMVFMSGYMRNFGTQASDPQMGMSWEQQYDLLFKSAMTEEERKHFWASSWSSQPIATTAQPQRG